MEEHKQATPQARLERTSPTRLPTRVITYAWGDRYVEDLLSLAVPALLAPGNLPYLASQVCCEVVILTEERLFPRVSRNPAIQRLRTICPFKLIGLDDLIATPDKYGMTLTYALHRGFADLGAAMTDHWMIFLNADFILADGSLRNLLGHLMRGERLVASPSYCVVAKEVMPELLKRVDPRTATLAISPREMAKLALAHRHNTIRGKTVNQKAFHIRYMEQFYWQVDDVTLLGYQLPIAIVGLRPERYVDEPDSYWDHGLMKEFCPNARADVIGDSDEFLMIELREKEVAQDQILPGSPEPREIAERMILWMTSYQLSFAQYPLTLHAADLPANIDEKRQKLRDFVDLALSYAPSGLPSHLDHLQWKYHWTGFLEARHQYLSSRLASRTETAEPPGYLSRLDQTWWELDGRQKRVARRRAELAEMMERDSKAIQDAMIEARHELRELDRQCLVEFARTPMDPDSKSRECFEQISFPRDTGAKPEQQAEKPSSPSDHWLAILKRYADKDATLQRKMEVFQQTLEASNADYLDRLHSLDKELEQLRIEYLLLIGKPGVPGASLFLRMRRGPAIPRLADRASAAGRVARKVYYAVFGKWPQVTKFSPYWGALRHLRRLAGEAAARSARDVLIVGDRSDIADGLVNLPGLHAWMSVAGLMTGGMGGSFAQPPQFDLCICDLEFTELARFLEICGAARRFIRPGGAIIGFYLNVDGGQLPINRNELAEDLSKIPTTCIYYAGLYGSAKLLRTFRSAVSIPRSLSVSFLANIVTRLGLLAPQVWMSNVIEGLLPNKRQSTLRDGVTSITIQMRFPEFEGDTGAVEHAKKVGIYIDGVEAPVVDDRVVAPSIANPPGTAVILAFGQSNAANSGERHYVPHGAVHVFNIFDAQFYRAIDPLPGASNDGGSVWGRLGDMLIDAGFARSVLIVPTAFGGTYVEDWAPGGQCYRRLMFALHRGESNANHTPMAADEYRGCFRSMLRGLRAAGVKAPIYVALATLCEDAPHPFQNSAQIRLGQRKVVSIWDRVLPGPDIDQIGIEHRRDGCHFSASGQELAARAWFKAVTAGGLKRLLLWSKYRLESRFAANIPNGVRRPIGVKNDNRS
jgi:hypothetical protein